MKSHKEPMFDPHVKKGTKNRIMALVSGIQCPILGSQVSNNNFETLGMATIFFKMPTTKLQN